MTFEAVLQTCKDNDGYELPELNEKLYLHFKGFARIENLGAFTATKALFLESNGLNAIEGLEPLVELRCLYLQQNLLEHVVPPPGWNGAPLPLPGAPPAPSPLAHLVNLVTLDLSQNRLSVLSGLEGLVKLNTLNVAKNNLASVAGIEHLALCLSVTNIASVGQPAGGRARAAAGALRPQDRGQRLHPRHAGLPQERAQPPARPALPRPPHRRDVARGGGGVGGGRQGGGDRHAARLLVQKQGAAHEAELLQGRRSITLYKINKSLVSCKRIHKRCHCTIANAWLPR